MLAPPQDGALDGELLDSPRVAEAAEAPVAAPAAVRPRRTRTDDPYTLFWHRNSGHILIVTITMFAALLRMWQLADLPPGLHGDEAWTGIDARRILSEGNIGPYVESALGQPSGALYWAAGVLAILGHGVFQVRFAIALLGIATVPLIYLAVRVMFDNRRVALLAALLLAMMQWHLVYSRVAFISVSWPLAEMAVLLFLFLALKLRKPLWFATAGLALGAGLATTYVYPVFLAGVLLFTALQIPQARPYRRGALAAGFAIMVVCTLITALPLIRFALNDPDTYYQQHNVFSLTAQPAYEAASATRKVSLVADATWDYGKLLVWGGRPDPVDATGRKAMIDWLSLLLIIGGIVYCLRHLREPSSQVLLLMLVVIPIGSVTWSEARLRSTVGLAPFLVMFMALSVDRLWTLAQDSEGRKRSLLLIAAPAAIALFALFNLGAYFQDFGPKDSFARFVYARPITAASQYAAGHPSKPYVYFFSGRWSYNYETRRYLAPNAPGEDRSTQFGRFDLSFDRSRDALVILMPPYLDLVAQLRNLYPDAQMTTRSDRGEVLFTAVFLPSVRPR